MEPKRVYIPGEEADHLDPRLDGGIPSRLTVTKRGVVSYRELGAADARPLLMTHAVPLSSLSWVAVIPHLVAGGLRPVAVDMPGLGGTPPAPAPLDMDGYAAVLEAVLDALDLDQVDLFGDATFAAAALRLAVERPERVRRLVFCHFPVFDDASRARLAEATPTWYHPDGRAPKIPMGAIQPRVSPERFELLRMRMAFDMYRSGPRSAEGYRALAHYDALADLRRLRMPVAFIWGEGDQFFPHHRTVLAACPDAQWYVLPAASYTPGYETPRALAAAVLDALDAAPAVSPASR